MAMSDRLLKAWYAGHPALSLLRPLESLYRRVVQRKRARFLAGEGGIYQSPVPVVTRLIVLMVAPRAPAIEQPVSTTPAKPSSTPTRADSGPVIVVPRSR